MGARRRTPVKVQARGAEVGDVLAESLARRAEDVTVDVDDTDSWNPRRWLGGGFRKMRKDNSFRMIKGGGKTDEGDAYGRHLR